MALHFEKYMHSIEETAALLILDNHCNCKELQVFPHAHNDHLPKLSIPAHTSHKLHGTYTAIYVSLSNHKVLTAIHVSNLYVQCILQNFIILVQQMHTIYQHAKRQQKWTAGYHILNIPTNNKEYWWRNRSSVTSTLFMHWLTSQGGTKSIPHNSISIPSSVPFKPSHRKPYK
jgi:hypothetical protein